MQKAIVVKGTDVYELNEVLKAGYKVVMTCPMPSSSGGETFSTKDPHCLVIVEK